MGLLPNSEFETLLHQEAATNTAALTQQPPPLTPEEQTARYGGPVGSKEYYDFKASSPSTVDPRIPRGLGREIGSAFGINLPPEEEFDVMPRTQQIGVVGGATLAAAVKFILGAPKEIAKAPVRMVYSTYSGWKTGLKGGDLSMLKDDKGVDVPLLGHIDTYFKTYDDAKNSGMGPLAAALQTGGTIAGDVSIAGSVAEATKAAFTPRNVLKPGEVVEYTKPIEATIQQSQGKTKIVNGMTDHPAEYYSVPKTQAKAFGGNAGDTFVKLTPASPDGSMVELSIVQTKRGPVDTMLQKLAPKSDISLGKFGPEKKLYTQVIPFKAIDGNPLALEAGVPEAAKTIAPIPPAPLKGFENKPISGPQISNLSTIGKVNGLETDLQMGVIKALTGKDVVSDLTQAEYVNVAQTMAKLNAASKYAPEATGFGTWLKSYASPTRYWTRDVQEATGFPVHDSHIAMETAARVSKVSEQAQLGELFSDPIISKYANPKYAEERRLVKAYREGDQSVITNNPDLSPETKSELIQAAKIFDAYYAKVGPDVGVPVDIFLDNYSPHISDIGGKFQLYKDKGELPGQSTFFAKQKRTGSLATQIDDEWALAEIYTRGGYKAKYYDPVLKRIGEFSDQLPPEIKNRFASYVQEKLGYAGDFEKGLDSVAATFNKKFGWNLPPDTARVLTNQAMNTMYSSAMSQPATWLRNAFQYPMMGYSYWGPKFMGEALTKALSKAGQAEFLKSGFSVDLGVPFGEELSRDLTPTGRLSNAYREGTQGILKPNSVVENRNRAAMYFQTKAIFDDTLSRYNAGKISWQQAEKDLGLNNLHSADANLIRQDLVQGDMKGAFEKLAQNAIDDTQFPYRRGESMKLSYGMAGHLGTSFMQWPVEYAHTLGKWIGTGQFDKIVRLIGSTSLIVRTFRDQYGIDFSNSFGLNAIKGLSSPLGQGGGPVVKTILNSTEALYNWFDKNDQELEKNKDALMREAKLAIPGGLEGYNVIAAYKAYKEGPNEEGLYPIRNSDGSLNYYAPFKDVFWGAMGMPSVEKAANNEVRGDMANAKFDYTRAKRKVIELYQDGLSSINAGDASGQKSIDEANKIIEEYGKKGLNLAPGPHDFDKYYIPANQRTFDALPDGLKAKFVPQIYPQAVPTQ